MSVLIGQDWASIPAANFLAAKELGLTELNLVRAVTEKNSIKKCKRWERGSLAHALQSIAFSCGTIFRFCVAEVSAKVPPDYQIRLTLNGLAIAIVCWSNFCSALTQPK
jgi:hypothetical protein